MAKCARISRATSISGKKELMAWAIPLGFGNYSEEVEELPEELSVQPRLLPEELSVQSRLLPRV
jgi:hypothetical protein